MACPFFLPRSPLPGFTCDAMPLGDLYGGECAAEAGAPVPIDIVRGCCNAGYARDRCARAALANADAFQFLIKARRGLAVDVAWSSERNHHPVAVGVLTVNPAEHIAQAEPLECQARAYAAAYLRQIG